MPEATKLVIGVHVNENTPREPNPHIPWTPEEIAVVAQACQAAGASVMHVHARTPDGGADHSAETYREIARLVRERTDLLLAPSLANVPGRTVEQRLANIVGNQGDPSTRADFLVTDMGCANMDLFDPAERRFVTTDKVFLNETATHQHLIARAAELGMTPYLASFNVSWTRQILAHLDSGALTEPVLIAFVLGGPEFLAAHPATVDGLRAHLAFLPDDRDIEWMVSAYRGNVLAVAEEAIGLGGHVAIGAGDHHYAELGCPSSADLVAMVAELGVRAGREIATPQDARRIFGLKESHAAG